MSSTDAITLPPVSIADLDVIAALVAAVGWPHRRADIAALIELGRGRLARAGDDRTFGVGLWWPFGDTAARVGLIDVAHPWWVVRGLGGGAGRWFRAAGTRLGHRWLAASAGTFLRRVFS